jgi:hypothetical protein
MSNEKQLLSVLIALSEGKDKAFTDLEIAKQSGISLDKVPEALKNSNLHGLLRATKIRTTMCPSCKKEVPLAEGIQSAFCRCKAIVNVSTVPKWSYILERQATEQKLFDHLLTEFGKQGFRTEEKEDTFCVLSNGAGKIAVSLKLTNYFLSDYYRLKGWSSSHGADSYVMLSFNFDVLVAALAQRQLTCAVYNIIEVLGEGFAQRVVDEIKLNKETAKALGIDQDKEDALTKELEAVEKGLNGFLDALPALALRSAVMPEKDMGFEFQKRIIHILNLAGIPASYRGGSNMVDGAVFITYPETTRKTDFIGIDAKTFKAKEGNTLYDITGDSAQIRKYCAATQTEDILAQLKPHSMVIFAYDFNTSASGLPELTASLKKEYGMTLVLFPLKSLLQLMRMMRIEQVYPRIPKDAMLELLTTEGYVDAGCIEKFIKKVEASNEKFMKSPIQQYRAQIKALK